MCKSQNRLNVPIRTNVSGLNLHYSPSMGTYLFPSPFAPEELMLHSDKWPRWNTEERTVNSIITLPRSLSVSVSRTRGRHFHLWETGRQEWHTFFFFSFLSCRCRDTDLLWGAGAWWQEAKEGWAGPKRKDQFQSSWSRDPRARRESLRESQPSARRLGRLWSRVGEDGRLVLWMWLRTGK